MLDRTLAWPVVPGTNQPAEVRAASWLLLLDTLDVGTALVVGRPDEATRSALLAVAERVLVAAPGPPTPGGEADPRVVRLDASPLPRTADLVVVLDPAARPDAADVVDDAHRRGAAVYWRGGGRRRWSPAASLVPVSRAPGALSGASADAPLWVPFGPGSTRAHPRLLDALGRAGRRLELRWRRRLCLGSGSVGRRRRGDPDRGGSALVVTAAAHRDGAGSGSLLWPGGGRSPSALPTWVEQLALEGGAPPLTGSWTVNVDGDYRSQKVLFRVGSDDGDLAIKVTRDAAFSERLANEHRSLELLAGAGVACVPRPVFLGWHRGLAVVGETALAGTALSQLDGSDADRHLDTAIEWANGLALAPGLRGRAGAAAVAEAMHRIVGQFATTCGSSPAVARLVADAIDRVSEAEMATVFLHGDLGTWNLLVGSDGLAVLDWENGDPCGAPVWDVAYLLLSDAMRSAARRGHRFRPAMAAERLRSGPWRQRLDRALAPQLDGLGLRAEVVEPLVVLSWCHLAAKESTRRPAGTGGSGFWAAAVGELAGLPGGGRRGLGPVWRRGRSSMR